MAGAQDEEEDLVDELDQLTRSTFLRRGVGVGALSALGPVVLGREAASAAISGGLDSDSRGQTGTLSVGLDGDLTTLDIHRSTLGSFYSAIKFTVFDGLVGIDSRLRFVPKLAQSWTVSPNGRRVTFRLRRGVVFHDGSPFRAQDVAYTIERIKNPATASAFVQNVDLIQRVQVVDPYTVVFHLKDTAPALLSQLLEVQIVSRRHSATIDKKPIGTGLFRFVEWIPGDRVVLERNPRYFIRGEPKIGRLVFRPIPDPQVAAANLRTGALQVIVRLSPTVLSQIASFARITASKPSARYESLHFNCSRTPFTDKRVRQAINFAFDRRSYVRTVWRGLARGDANVWPREYPSYLPNSDATWARYDLDRARSLLASAGFTDRRPLEMEIMNALGSTTMRQASLILQDALGGLGHKITVVNLEQSAWIDRLVNRPNFDASTIPWGMRGPDPAGNLNSQALHPTQNLARWNPSGYANLVNAANTENNPTRRTAIFRQLQRVILEEMPFIVLCHAPALSATATNVRGWRIGPVGYFDGWGQIYLA